MWYRQQILKLVTLNAVTDLQKQPPEVFYKKDVLKKFANFTGKHLSWSLFLIKLQAFSPAASLKRDSKHRYFLVKFAKLLRTPILKDICELVLLDLEKKRWMILEIVEEVSNRRRIHLITPPLLLKSRVREKIFENCLASLWSSIPRIYIPLWWFSCSLFQDTALII